MAHQVVPGEKWAKIEPQPGKELYEELNSLYGDENDLLNGTQDAEVESDNNYDIKKMPLSGPEDEDDILHPLRQAVDRVGFEVEQFAQILDSYNPQKITEKTEKQKVIFEMIEKFHDVALSTVSRLREKNAIEKRKIEGRKWKKKMRGFKITKDETLESPDDITLMDSGSGKTIEDLEHWEQEAQTWDLLKRLTIVRFANRPSKSKPIHRYISRQELYDHFFQTEEMALERKTILQWLKDTAEDLSEDLDILVEGVQKNAKEEDIIAYGWLYTKAAIKNHKRKNALYHPLDPNAQDIHKELMNTTKTESITTQLDPDAPYRQGLKLASEDQHFERAVWFGCYELLRRGSSSKEISAWCLERLEIWRAVSILGVSFEEFDEGSEYANMNAMIRWRKICLSIAHSSGLNEYEKAVYGIISGDISSVEPVCKSWDDFMFIQFNSLLRIQFDNYLKKISLYSNTSNLYIISGDLNDTQGQVKFQATRPYLIENLIANPKISKESSRPMKILQGVLVADRFAHFIFQQGIALSLIANAKEKSRVIPVSKHQLEDGDLIKYIELDDHNSLRVLTHVLLIFMGLGLDLGDVYRETEIQNVIVAYISFLKLAAKEELIPLYCSQLSGKRKYSILCRNLIDVIDEEQRIVQLKLIQKLGLDAQEFVSLQARYLLDDFPDLITDYPAMGNVKLFSDNPNKSSPYRSLKTEFISEDYSVERIDLLLIRSLQWYLLVDGLWVETFRLGTLLYLRFFKHMNLHAAKMLSINISSKTLMERKTRAILGESINLFNFNPNDKRNSTDALKTYMLAEAINFRELESLVECLDNIDTANCLVAIKKQGLSNQVPPILLRDWRHDYQIACEESRSCANILMNDWLLTSPNENIVDELKLLRQAYLPETLLAYISMLHIAGLYINRDFILEAMEVSSLIAKQDSNLLEIFIKAGRVKEMVDIIARASKTLLTLSTKQTSISRGVRLKKRGFMAEIWNMIL